MKFLYIYIFAALTLCCQGKKNSYSFEITSPTYANKVVEGNSIGFVIKTNQEPDSLKVYIEGKMLTALTDYTIAADHRVGTIPYRIAAYSDGDSCVRSGDFLVLPSQHPKYYGYRVVKTYPHDKKAYTQGLYFDNGTLYEGTGIYGESSLRRVDLNSGKVTKNIPLDSQYFGEGVASLDGKVYQLTWTNGKGFIYDQKTLSRIGEFSYEGEGWGITSDGTKLYMSNGSDRIYTISPDEFKREGYIEVCTPQGKVAMINELEWIEGDIWANIYMTDQIMIIDPLTGRVKGVIDFTGILKEDGMDVLNGIAYNKESHKIYITGKNWSKLFEIEIK